MDTCWCSRTGGAGTTSVHCEVNNQGQGFKDHFVCGEVLAPQRHAYQFTLLAFRLCNFFRKQRNPKVQIVSEIGPIADHRLWVLLHCRGGGRATAKVQEGWVAGRIGGRKDRWQEGWQVEVMHGSRKTKDSTMGIL